MYVLLVEPAFPIPPKSKNHSNFLPIGLLKLASYYRNRGDIIELVRGNIPVPYTPDLILITSLFTYWSVYVRDSVIYYRTMFPASKISVGGIYATLMPEHCKEYTTCDEVFIGQHSEADACNPAYDLVNVDYQIIHGMRGCSRKCSFCGIWRIENLSFKTCSQIEKEIQCNKLIFYDNNILINPDIENILIMLSSKLVKGKVVKSECQSGFDGRVLAQHPHYALLLKKARFENIRIAWDFAYTQHEEVYNWIKLLKNAGYNQRSIFVFMVYNWDVGYLELEAKRRKCFEWEVQIADCRYRPLNQTFDNYCPNSKNQTNDDYYINSLWTDALVKRFRSDVRKHNICLRYKIKWDNYDTRLEHISKKKTKLG